MKTHLKAHIIVPIFVTFVIAVIGVSVFVFIKKDTSVDESGTELVDKTYKNEIYGFSFTVPAGYTVRETEDTILVENSEGKGVQILISEMDEDIPVLTEDMIRKDIPDMIISDTQTVEIGENRMGLAFKSDNEAFDGASREVWFVYNSMFYQISTYEYLDPFLKEIFATWEFSVTEQVP